MPTTQQLLDGLRSQVMRDAEEKHKALLAASTPIRQVRPPLVNSTSTRETTTREEPTEMMSLATIREINQARAVEAAEEGAEPFVYFSASEVDEMSGFPFAHLGDYRPEGWEEGESYFVDASGFGTPGEPALTAEQFREVIRDRITANAAEGKVTGWAVTEAGQFQVHVTEFTRRVRAA